MADFFGEHEQTIDSKRRLPITAALREWTDPGKDGANFVLLQGPNDCPWLYPDLYFRRLVKMVKRSPLSNDEHRKIAVQFAQARLLKPDAQGRVVLPADRTEQAGLSNDVVLLGIDDHIEIWNRQAWQATLEDRNKERSKLGDVLLDASRRLESESVASSE